MLTHGYPPEASFAPLLRTNVAASGPFLFGRGRQLREALDLALPPPPVTILLHSARCPDLWAMFGCFKGTRVLKGHAGHFGVQLSGISRV